MQKDDILKLSVNEHSWTCFELNEQFRYKIGTLFRFTGEFRDNLPVIEPLSPIKGESFRFNHDYIEQNFKNLDGTDVRVGF